MKRIVLLIICILLLCSCNNKEDENINDVFKIGYSSNMLDLNDKTELEKVLKDNSVSNVDLFFSWLNDFNKEEDMGCGLKDWNKTDTFIYDDVKCNTRYEKNHDISDGDCRITAYALMRDLIDINTKENEYGTYLMFDMDVIENNKDYQLVNDNQLEFINLFNEIDVSKINKEEYKNAFPKKLKEHNFKVKEGNVSLISVVMHDNEFNLLFVGHAGVLIDLKDKYLFIEKIAFEQPYQVSVIKSKEDLSSLFKNRSSYFGDGTEEGPFIYENNTLIYEY